MIKPRGGAYVVEHHVPSKKAMRWVEVLLRRSMSEATMLG